MYFAGVDLAWAGRNPSGVAVVDSDGDLVSVGAARDDDEILAALRPYVRGDCVVAFDAPLVVNNPTGQRPAETALNRDFRRFEAGTHPCNTGKPEFANGPRGGRLAAALGLDLDPRSPVGRRAVEVYPHAATVALFGLERTLKYKAKPGRSVDRLKSELLVLMDEARTARAGPDPAARRRARGLGRVAGGGGRRAPQMRAAPRRGSGRRGRLCLRGVVRAAPPGRDDDLRRR